MAVTNKLAELARNLFFVTLLNHNLFAHAEECQNTTSMGYSGILCRGNRTSIPQDLSPDIEVLEITEAKFKNLMENDLKRYSNLKVLRISYTKIENELDHFLFRPLTEVKVLEFVSNAAPNYFSMDLEIPTSVESLLLSYNPYITNPDLLKHSNITTLHLDYCGLTNFPHLNTTAPLEELHLQFNPLKTFTADDVVPFCRLRRLGLEWSDVALMPTKEQYCECIKLETWISDHHIINPLRLPMNCTANSEQVSPEYCDLAYSEVAMDLYHECLQRSVKPPRYKKKWLLVIVPAVILAIIALIYAVLRFCSRDRPVTPK